MAVYTQIDAAAMADIIARFDVGALISFKGIAEGVENSNYLVDTSGGRFILTVYEKRVNPDDLPYFLSLLDHLADHCCPVPRCIHDRKGERLQRHGEKFLALIEFLPGLSVTRPSADQAHAVGRALASLHLAVGDFAMSRANDLSLAGWRKLHRDCGAQLDAIREGMAASVAAELDALEANWPASLPRSVIHADLFPDNVLMQGADVAGLIDFYFSCNDLTAYDLAVTHSAWCFSPEGKDFDAAVSNSLIAGYQSVRPLSVEELAAMPLLARGASLRFTLTRAYDWVNTPASAVVTRKDPLAFYRRLEFYRDPANAAIWG